MKDLTKHIEETIKDLEILYLGMTDPSKELHDDATKLLNSFSTTTITTLLEAQLERLNKKLAELPWNEQGDGAHDALEQERDITQQMLDEVNGKKV